MIGLRTTTRRHHAAMIARSRRGMVLIVVMIVIVIVSLAGFAFAALMFTERKAVTLYGDEMQLTATVASGEELLKSKLALPASERNDAGGIFDDPERFRGVLVFEDEDTGRRARFSVVSPRIEDDAPAGVRFGVEDESSRLNLGVLAEWERRLPGSAKSALMRLPAMTETAAESILDWVDVDSEPRGQGAEDDYYSGLEARYAPRNAAPESLEELLLVKEVTRELLFGADSNRDFAVDRLELQAQATASTSSKATKEALPWAMFLTTCSAERNLREDGRPRINLNEANLARLQQSLSTALDARWARFIVAYRQYGPSANAASAASDNGAPIDTSRPAKFPIPSIYDLVASRVEIPSANSNSSPSVIVSPVRDDRDSMRKELPRLLDCTTTDASPTIVGRISVNSATKAVLSAVPGLDDALAEQIVSARAAQIGSQRPETRYACWLLTDGLVDLAKMRAIAPYLNGGGDVFRAQIVGFWDHPAPMARLEVVVDASTLPPRVSSRQDLRLLGPAFSAEELGAGEEGFSSGSRSGETNTKSRSALPRSDK